MKYSDIVSFRKDLLFDGAVQISWFEKNEELAQKAAEHFVFHGPNYHGVVKDSLESSEHSLIDTATFTLNILERVSGLGADDPFALAIAGYGTGKSHIGITLASLLSNPRSHVVHKILENLSLADKSIGEKAKQILENTNKPFLVVTLNGMQDFYLNGEIMRQIIAALTKANLDTSILKNLRPRFRTAASFTESLYSLLKDEFSKHFDPSYGKKEIVDLLNNQDENVFMKVNKIYEQTLGNPITASGQESLHEFISVTKNHFCGLDKPFAGIVILFDEFGRYLEFAVQKPYIAGSGALQQLFEAVQGNSDSVFLLAFIQYELKAYISRIAPELREDINRYVGRFDFISKYRLSSNLETLIANLFEKKDLLELENQVAAIKIPLKDIQASMKDWFPDLNNHALWLDQKQFENIVVKGCWPLNPVSTWVLNKLSTVGKSLQQRSAFSFIADIFESYKNKECLPGQLILPIDLCNDAMIDEFLASEQYGQQGATAHAYQSVIHKHQYELSQDQRSLLKAILVSSKIGYKVKSKQECLQLLSVFSGLDIDKTEIIVNYLESEFAVLEWNDTLSRFDLVGDSVPKKSFMAILKREAGKIASRGEIFSHNYMKWSGIEVINTDFGIENNIDTKEWHYNALFSCLSLLNGQIEYSMQNWLSSINVDVPKGHLIYCYVGPESIIEEAKQYASQTLKNSMEKNNIDLTLGAPIAIQLLNDTDGSFGQKVAENWILAEHNDEEFQKKFSNYIRDHKNNLKEEMDVQFSQMELQQDIIFGTDKAIKGTKLKDMLTELFDVIYYQRIPFPFGKFDTARGNAAADSQQFTRELVLGNLDKEWIDAQNRQQRNRAHELFVKSWGIFGKDGSLRLKPTNEAVRNIIDLIEAIVVSPNNDTKNDAMSMGEVMRLLCAPPYGCNLASVGLILALFIGKRKDEINIMFNDEFIDFQKWLHLALSGRFFELSVLDASYLVSVDKEELSEWEALLEKWEDEKKLLTRLDYCKKAEELQKRVSIPSTNLNYRYKWLQDKSKTDLISLKEYNDILNNELDKIYDGLEHNDIRKISWGGANLLDFKNKMNKNEDLWTDEQFEEISTQIEKAIQEIKIIFSSWLSALQLPNVESLGKFKDINKKIAMNLEKLGLLEEQKLLNEYVEKVDKKIKIITELNRLTSDIDNMVKTNIITESTPVSALNSFFVQADKFEEDLKGANQKIGLPQADVDKAAKVLADYTHQIQKQLLSYNERMTELFNINSLLKKSDLEYWRREIAALIGIYNGQPKDVEDLKQVLKHLDLIESHITKLSDSSLTNEELAATFDSCIQETEKNFYDDAPPLDYENIYDELKKDIVKRREETANQWFKRNVPDINSVPNLAASGIIQLQKALLSSPQPILSESQMKIVKDMLAACEKRLDELELEGLLARFKALSIENMKLFIDLASSYIKYSG